MQELLLIEEVFNLVEKGVKHSTLRKGKRDITTGLLTFKMTESPDIQTLVNVTKVTYLPYAEITEEDAIKEGYATLKELQEVLYRIYGDIYGIETFTLIEFEKS